MRKYVFIMLALAGSVSSFAQSKTGAVKPKRKAVVCAARSCSTKGSACLPAKPVIHASGATEFCEGQSIQLSVVTEAPSVLWSTGATGSAIKVTRSGDFTVTVTDAKGSRVTSAPVKVIVNPYPDITAITPGLRCGHGQNLLSAKANAGTVRWHAGATDAATISQSSLYFTRTYLAPCTDTFYVDADYRGCISKRIAVTSVVEPPVDVTTTVSGPTITANRSDAKYQWVDCNKGSVYIPGETRQSFTPLSKGDYAVIVTENTCSEPSSCVSMQTIVAEASSSRIILYMFSKHSNRHYTLLANAEGSYTLLDEKGKAIRTVQLNGANNLTATNETFSKSRYFVVGENNNLADRQKLIIAK